MTECKIRDVGRSSAGAIGRRRFSDVTALRVKHLGKGGILSHVGGLEEEEEEDFNKGRIPFVGGVGSAMADFIIWSLH